MGNAIVIFRKMSAIWVAVIVVLLMVMLIVSGCVPINHSPEIVSLEAGAEVVGPSNSCLIECLAWDQDGDELTYNWTAERGKITNIDQKGARVAWIAPKPEGLYSITVVVQDGKKRSDTDVSDSITIRVKDNHAPLITGLVADPEWVVLSGSCQISCAAEDQDGDELNYEWQAANGKISGTGQTVEWKAPGSPGLYEIISIVSDGYGKEVTRSISISVSQYPPPVIEKLIVTPEDPRYFKEHEGGYMILRDRKCTIECVIADPNEELIYEWSDGKDTYTGPGSGAGATFAGEGSTITWTAPGKGIDVTITVLVYDEIGNAASKSISFEVETCGCAF
jgi:hypothetical protein